MADCLGSPFKMKCIQDEGGHVYVRCAAVLLQNLDIEHPVGQLVTSSVKAFHDRHGNCVRTLVLMLMFWYREVCTLVHSGIPTSAVVVLMNEALEACINHLKDRVISLHHLNEMVLQGENAEAKIADSSVSCLPAKTRLSDASDRKSDAILMNSGIPTTNFQDYKESSPPDRKICENDRVNLIKEIDENEIEIQNEDDDEDDISWYFEDGKIPDPPSLDEVVTCLTESGSVLEDTFISDINQKKHVPGDTQSMCAADALCSSEKLISKSQTSQSPICNLEKSVHKENTHFTHHGDALCSTSPGTHQQNMTVSFVNTSCRGNKDEHEERAVEQDDDFDSCFDNIEYQTRSKSVYCEQFVPMTSGNRNNSVNMGLDVRSEIHGNSFVMDSPHSSVTESEAVSDSNQSSDSVEQDVDLHDHHVLNQKLNEKKPKLHLTEKLELIMKKKEKLQKTKSVGIINQSRHFKTVESTVKQSCDKMKEAGELHCADNVVPPDDQTREEPESSVHSQNSYSNSQLHPSALIDQLKLRELSSNTNCTNSKKESRSFKMASSQVEPTSFYNSLDSENKKCVNCETLNKTNRTVCVHGNSIAQQHRCCDKANSRISQFIHTDKETTKVKDVKKNSRPFDTQKYMMRSRYLSEGTLVNDLRKGSKTDSIGDVDSSHPHFSHSDSAVKSSESEKMSSQVGEPDELYDHDNHDLHSLLHLLGRGLSHGCNEEMELLLEIIIDQNKTAKHLNEVRFNIDSTHCISIHGARKTRSCVVPGIVVKTTPTQMAVIQQNEHTHHTVLLVNGEISECFRHKGYTQPVISKTVLNSVKQLQQRQPFQDALDVLQKLAVTLILVTGTVDSVIADYCSSHHIIVLERVPFKAVQQISMATNAKILTYVTDADEDSIGLGVSIENWSCDWMDQVNQSENKSFACVCLPHTSWTVVLSDPCREMLAVREEEFWHCAHRVGNVLRHGQLVQGGGNAEAVCADFLQGSYDASVTIGEHQSDLNIYKTPVLEGVRNGFHQYIKQLSINTSAVAGCCSRDTRLSSHNDSTHCKHCSSITGSESVDDSKPSGKLLCDSEAVIYDDYNTKAEAWRTAMHLLTLILQTDSHIVTGVERQNLFENFSHDTVLL